LLNWPDEALSHIPVSSIDRDKSPQLDADHDIVRIAEALRRSPHIRTVDDVEPGDEAVWFSDASGNGTPCP
jgi:hypothetical protein